MKAVVVGYGRMGGFHAKVLHNLGYRVTTIDPRPESGARYPRLIPGSYFDAGVVAVPIKHLAEVAVDVERRCNRILIEKPGAANAAEARELRDDIGTASPVIGYTERFNPLIRVLKDGMSKEARHGMSAQFTRWSVRPSPDVWLDLASHDVDLAQWLGLGACTFDVKADSSVLVRRIVLDTGGETITVDLTAHGREPLYAQNARAFLMRERNGLASLNDAVKILEEVEELRRCDHVRVYG